MSGKITHGFESWMRMMEKRMLAQERRAMPTAADLLGPGLAGQAIQVADWNDDLTLSNGIFFSAAGAQNSPGNTRAWIGWVLCDGNGGGIQRVVAYDAGTLLRSVRTFSTTTGQLRSFGAWTAEP